MSSTDSANQTVVRERVAAARMELEVRMRMAGMTSEKGWHVLERVIDSPEGSTWVFLPMHAKGEQAPNGLGAAVSIDQDGKIRE